MTTQTEMYVDFVDRTREFLADPRESFSELAWHTGLDQKWIKNFASCDETSAHRQDSSKVVLLYNWLILLELVAADSRFGPYEAMLLHGRVAVYEFRQLQQAATSGILIIGERAHVLKKAEARLEQLQRGSFI
jgi:hypothetical protein